MKQEEHCSSNWVGFRKETMKPEEEEGEKPGPEEDPGAEESSFQETSPLELHQH